MLSDAARTRRVIIVCSGWQQRWRGFSYCTFANLVDGCSGSAAASSEVSLLLWTCISPPGRRPVLIPLSHFFLISWFVSPGNGKRPRPRPAVFPLYLFLRLWGWKKNNNNTMNKTWRRRRICSICPGLEVQGRCVKDARWAEGAGKWSWALQTAAVSLGSSAYLRKLAKWPLGSRAGCHLSKVISFRQGAMYSARGNTGVMATALERRRGEKQSLACESGSRRKEQSIHARITILNRFINVENQFLFIFLSPWTYSCLRIENYLEKLHQALICVICVQFPFCNLQGEKVSETKVLSFHSFTDVTTLLQE